MSTRVATLADVAAVHALMERQLVEHHIAVPATLGATVEGAIRAHATGCFCVTLDDNRIIGAAYISINWTIEHGGLAAYLQELYVIPEKRLAGRGTALLRAVYAEAKAYGCVAIDLEVEASQVRVERLYEREGFVRHKRTRFYKRL